MRILAALLFFITVVSFGQNEIIAKQYFEKGDFQKALLEYKKLHTQSPSNLNYIDQVVKSYQQLQQYGEVELFLNELLNKNKYPSFYVELGYNYQLQKDFENAKRCYNKAIESLDISVSFIYAVGQSFENRSLLSQAIEAYNKAMQINPMYDFNLQLANLYGQQGNIEMMFDKYLDYVDNNPEFLQSVKLHLAEFVTESGLNENNALLRKMLIKKSQQNSSLMWYELLSWLFVQQKEFEKAFLQEKAIYTRSPESLDRLIDLAQIAFDENQIQIAKSIYTFIIESAQDSDTKLNAYNNLLQIQIKESEAKDYGLINSKFVELFDLFGISPQTLTLQISYAHFLAFNMNEPVKATDFLEKTLKLPLGEIEQADVKLELGDILVLQEKFNQALIYYSQIQRNLKNSTISQNARFKVAKASYYKGDFNWAESQLKILKSSTSQLIANDALELKLLISDNKNEDSLQTALKLYAKADLLSFQNKTDQALSILETILKNHKTEPIIPQALYQQAILFETKKEYAKAEANYQSIIANYKDGILIDDALFKLASIYEYQFSLPEKAKTLYEQILFNHQDSIYFVEARKRYRNLRGDTIN